MLDNMDDDGADRAGRSRTLDRVPWWCDLASERAAAAGLSHIRLAQQIGTTETAVQRCPSGKVLGVALAQALSKVLEIPPPLFVPTSEDEALAIVAALELRRVRAQVAVLAAGVDQRAEGRQADPLASIDGRKRKRGRVERTRARPSKA